MLSNLQQNWKINVKLASMLSLKLKLVFLDTHKIKIKVNYKKEHKKAAIEQWIVNWDWDKRKAKAECQ